MICINPSTINDLLALKESGAPVTLTSHPGNASLYKLSLWHCGIPEHLWDVTCCKADANNWPMHRLTDGKAELLLDETLYERICRQTSPGHRFVTAYQKTKDGERLGRVHVRAMEQCFPHAISSCSRLLRSEAGRVEEMFAFLAETCPERVFTRYITPDGRLVPIRESGLARHELATSFMRVLKELDHLLFSDESKETVGGACYDGAMVSLSDMLVQYWQSGRIDRYDISGPDMINYATRPEHQASLSQMLDHLRTWDARLVPKHFAMRMFPGTGARVGHITGHVSEAVLARKRAALQNQNPDKDAKRRMWEAAREDVRLWPSQIRPNMDYYFSQHDLLAQGGTFSVHDYWKDIPLEDMQAAFIRADSLLRIPSRK